MEKVYFNNEYYGSWWLKSLEDFYEFDCIDITTNEASSHILSWTRNLDVSIYGEDVIRVYDIEIDSKKYYFITVAKKDGYLLSSREPFELEKLINEKNIIFTGTAL